MLKKWMLAVVCGLLSITASAKGGFSLWQLAAQSDKIGNSYVMQTDKGKVIVMDGGYREEAPYLRGFIAALGGKVDLWIVPIRTPTISEL